MKKKKSEKIYSIDEAMRIGKAMNFYEAYKRKTKAEREAIRRLLRGDEYYF